LHDRGTRALDSRGMIDLCWLRDNCLGTIQIPRAILFAAVAVCICACATTPRVPFTLEEQTLARVPGMPSARFWSDDPHAVLREELRAILLRPRGVRPAVLALSSGGADGAFGAGVLVGWTQTGTRPQFSIVSGVRWRACDLIMRLHEEFGLSVSDDTVYALKDLGFSHVSARPRAYKQDAAAMETFKKTSPSAWRKSAKSSHRALR
jgi:hypothetical protein